jgi:hypothetical protein
VTIRAFFAAAVLAAIPAQSLAWGSTGHTMINRLAAQTLPASLPAFVRAPSAVAEIGTLGPEEDRIKGAGESWDGDNDDGHFLDINDDGTVAGAVHLDALPPNMGAYTAALAASGTNPYKTGFLPYSIMDGFERVREDFAYWRVDAYMAAHAATAPGRAAFSADEALRAQLTLRDIGDWGHFVADGSQPLHLTIHFNGWGNYPNPNNFTANHIHAFFESTFVDRYAKPGAVRAMIPAYHGTAPAALLTQAEIAHTVGTYLMGSSAQVVPLYKLYAAGAFDRGAPSAVTFTDAQLARGAAMLRDLTTQAWEDSLNASFGYPSLAVKDVLSGEVVPRNLSD